jgi:uncharacterized protein YcbX
MIIGTVKQIWRYAVKSMAGEQLESSMIGLRGIPGDRGWVLKDETTGKFITGGKHPLLMQCSARYREAPRNGFIPHVDMRFPDGIEGGSDLPDINARLTQLLGKPVSLSASTLGDQFDAYPIHVLTTASLEVMSRWNSKAKWDVRRFRPNIFVETEPGIEGFVEFGWRTMRVGDVELKCEMPAERCAMTTHAQDGLAKDPSVLRSIVEAADQNLGIYSSVITAGEVRVGDQVDAD